MKNKYEIRGDVTIIYAKHNGQEMQILIDTDDLPRLLQLRMSWRIKKGSSTFYCSTTITIAFKKRQHIVMHRWLLGETDPKIEIDHINHNGLDNRSSVNLRRVSKSQNQQNLRSARNSNAIGIRNVMWSKNNKRWLVKIVKDEKPLYFQYFDNLDEAKHAAEQARARLFPFSSDARNIKLDPSFTLNHSDIYRNNTSGVRGVNFHKKMRKWCVRIRRNNALVYTSYHDEFEEAVKDSEEARKKYGTA